MSGGRPSRWSVVVMVAVIAYLLVMAYYVGGIVIRIVS